MIVVDSLIIIGFLIYCFWYACKYHPDGVKMVLLCMAPILGACLIPLTCEHGSKEELISICVMMGLQVVWIPLLILIADQDQKSGNRDKRINKLCEDAVSNWQEQLAGLGYEHPRDVVSLLLEPDSPAMGRNKFDLMFAERWLRMKYKNKIDHMSDGELEEMIGILLNDLPDYEYPFEYKVNGIIYHDYVDWRHNELNTSIVVDKYLTTVDYDYPEFHLTMHAQFVYKEMTTSTN